MADHIIHNSSHTGIPASKHAAAGEKKRMEMVRKNQAEAKEAAKRFKIAADKAKAAEMNRSATMIANMKAKHRKE